MGYAGTLDLLFTSQKSSDVWKIWDFKSSAKFKKKEWIENGDFFLQMIAYIVAVKKLRGISPECMEVIICQKGKETAARFSRGSSHYKKYWVKFKERLILYYDKFPVRYTWHV